MSSGGRYECPMPKKFHHTDSALALFVSQVIQEHPGALGRAAATCRHPQLTPKCQLCRTLALKSLCSARVDGCLDDDDSSNSSNNKNKKKNNNKDNH